MSEPGNELSPTAWAVLGVLSFPAEADLSGYDVKSWADRSLRFFYTSPAMSQVYRELKQLESVGYLTSYLVPQDELRNKRLYRITEAGRAAVREWAAAPALPPVIKHAAMLRVWLGHLLGLEQLRAVLLAHIEYAERMRAEATELERSAHRQKLWPHPELALRWSTRYYESEAELARGLLKDLEELRGDERVDDATADPDVPGRPADGPARPGRPASRQPGSRPRGAGRSRGPARGA
jgi:DNA-binding PadR family transcriptional regulator